jgi:hypothetical protein
LKRFCISVLLGGFKVNAISQAISRRREGIRNLALSSHELWNHSSIELRERLMLGADGRQACGGLLGQADTNERHASSLITHQYMGKSSIAQNSSLKHHQQFSRMLSLLYVMSMLYDWNLAHTFTRRMEKPPHITNTIPGHQVIPR